MAFNSMTCKILLIDIDDTLLDFSRGEKVAFRRTFRELGLSYRAEYLRAYHTINVEWWARYDRGEVPIDEVLRQRWACLFAHIGLPLPEGDLDGLYEKHLRQQHAYVRGAKGFLRWAMRHYRVYAVSNGRQSVQTLRIRQSGLYRYLEDTFTSEKVGYHKPQPEFFHYVATHISDYKQEETVLIGDSLTSDMAGGRVAGVKTVWFTQSPNPKPDFVDYKLSNFVDLKKLLKKLS